MTHIVDRYLYFDPARLIDHERLFKECRIPRIAQQLKDLDVVVRSSLLFGQNIILEKCVAEAEQTGVSDEYPFVLLAASLAQMQPSFDDSIALLQRLFAMKACASSHIEYKFESITLCFRVFLGCYSRQVRQWQRSGTMSSLERFAFDTGPAFEMLLFPYLDKEDIARLACCSWTMYEAMNLHFSAADYYRFGTRTDAKNYWFERLAGMEIGSPYVLWFLAHNSNASSKCAKRTIGAILEFQRYCKLSYRGGKGWEEPEDALASLIDMALAAHTLNGALKSSGESFTLEKGMQFARCTLGNIARFYSSCALQRLYIVWTKNNKAGAAGKSELLPIRVQTILEHCPCLLSSGTTQKASFADSGVIVALLLFAVQTNSGDECELSRAISIVENGLDLETKPISDQVGRVFASDRRWLSRIVTTLFASYIETNRRLMLERLARLPLSDVRARALKCAYWPKVVEEIDRALKSITSNSVVERAEKE